jgi:hypothetical protein
MLATSRGCTHCVFRSHVLNGHDFRETAIDRELELNRTVWRQRIRHPTAYTDRVCLRNLSAYPRIEKLKSSYTQNEANNQYFQQ